MFGSRYAYYLFGDETKKGLSKPVYQDFQAATSDYGAKTNDALKEAFKAIKADIENIWMMG